jgi:hypothetical protein
MCPQRKNSQRKASTRGDVKLPPKAASEGGHSVRALVEPVANQDSRGIQNSGNVPSTQNPSGAVNAISPTPMSVGHPSGESNTLFQRAAKNNHRRVRRSVKQRRWASIIFTVSLVLYCVADVALIQLGGNLQIAVFHVGFFGLVTAMLSGALLWCLSAVGFEAEQKDAVELLEELALMPIPPNLIGLVIPEHGNPFFSHLSFQLNKFLAQDNLSLLTMCSENNAARQIEIVSELQRLQARAILFCGVDMQCTDSARFFNALTSPIILVDRHIAGLDADFFGLRSGWLFATVPHCLM